jgi:hypothetical protein
VKAKTKKATKEELKRYDDYCSLMSSNGIQPRSQESWLEIRRAVRERLTKKKEASS